MYLRSIRGMVPFSSFYLRVYRALQKIDPAWTKRLKNDRPPSGQNYSWISRIHLSRPAPSRVPGTEQHKPHVAVLSVTTDLAFGDGEM